MSACAQLDSASFKEAQQWVFNYAHTGDANCPPQPCDRAQMALDSVERFRDVFVDLAGQTSGSCMANDVREAALLTALAKATGNSCVRDAVLDGLRSGKADCGRVIGNFIGQGGTSIDQVNMSAGTFKAIDDLARQCGIFAGQC